jgi:XTP/dITP diphosphohydrolase
MYEPKYPYHVLIASGNASKISELTPLLVGIHCLTMTDVGRFELEEPGPDYRANAAAKALEASRRSGHVTLADDSGIEVDALNGEPGYLSARYAGDHHDDRSNRQKLSAALRDIPGVRRGALYRCTLALADAQGPMGDNVVFTEGIWRGQVLPEERGGGGFGYDPMFVPEGFETTVAEIPQAIKNKVSHRAKAVAAMRMMLRAYLRYR